MVDAAGVEPAVPGAADLQSTGVTNFPTHPYFVTLSRYAVDRGSSGSRECVLKCSPLCV